MRGLFSTLIIILIAGAIGFGVGVYVTPPDEALQFHSYVNEKLEQIKQAIHSARAGKSDAPLAEKPQANAPAEPEPVKEATPEPSPPPRTGSNSDCDPTDPKCAGVGGAPSEALVPMDRPSETAAEPSAPAPAPSSAGETTSATSGATAPAPIAPAATTPAETDAKPAVAKTAAKPPVKKPKPKPKPVARPTPSEPVDMPAN
jgi:hypothetical protein